MVTLTRRGALGALVGGAAAAVGGGVAVDRLAGVGQAVAGARLPTPTPGAAVPCGGPLRVLEVASLEPPVLAVLGDGALALRPGLDAALRDRLVADARARPDDWD